MISQVAHRQKVRIPVIAIAVTLILMTCLTSTAVEPTAPLTLRILSYNIHHGEGVDGKLDLARIAAVIKAEKPDLVALQEVDQKTKRTKSVDQPAELARLTEMEVVFGGNIRLQGGEYGNALLSKHPIKRHQNHLLPNIDRSEQRGVLEVELELPGVKQPLLFLATHFDYRGDDHERIASAHQINDMVKKVADRSAILAGDLNDVLGSKTLEELQTVWISANTKPQPTVPVDKPASQIDFILFHPAPRWRIRAFRVLDEAVASDHRPVLAEVEMLLKP